MHTLTKKEDGTYDVIFCMPNYTEVVFTDFTFEMAIWYVNILNGGSGKFDKERI